VDDPQRYDQNRDTRKRVAAKRAQGEGDRHEWVYGCICESRAPLAKSKLVAGGLLRLAEIAQDSSQADRR